MNDNPAQEAQSPLAAPDPWSLVAEGYSETTRQYLAGFSQAGLTRLDYGTETEVIDVACGPGTTAIPLAPEVARIACVDFSEGMLAELQRNVEAASVTNIEICRADGQALPFADAGFDIGISMFGLMFFPDRAKGFAELHRVLRPGGQALVSSWAPMDRSPLMQVVMAALRPDDAPPQPPETPPGLEVPEIFEAEMRAAGFTDVEISPVTRAVDVRSPEAFWRDTVRGTAPIALLKRQMGEREWAAMEERAVARITAALGTAPTALSSTAWLATGRRGHPG